MNITSQTISINRKVITPLLLLPIWFLIYHFLKPATDWLVDDVFGMTAGPQLTEALRFFIFEVPKVLLLLTLIIFLVGIVRSYFSPEKTRKALEDKSLFKGNVLASLIGKSTWYSVPLSVIIGVPLYSNAAGIIPIVSVLIEKGASLGTALVFMIAVIGLSLPEMIIQKKVLKLPFILTFTSIIAVGIMLVGFLFNLIM